MCNNRDTRTKTNQTIIQREKNDNFSELEMNKNFRVKLNLECCLKGEAGILWTGILKKTG